MGPITDRLITLKHGRPSVGPPRGQGGVPWGGGRPEGGGRPDGVGGLRDVIVTSSRRSAPSFCGNRRHVAATCMAHAVGHYHTVHCTLRDTPHGAIPGHTEPLGDTCRGYMAHAWLLVDYLSALHIGHARHNTRAIPGHTGSIMGYALSRWTVPGQMADGPIISQQQQGGWSGNTPLYQPARVAAGSNSHNFPPRHTHKENSPAMEYPYLNTSLYDSCMSNIDPSITSSYPDFSSCTQLQGSQGYQYSPIRNHSFPTTCPPGPAAANCSLPSMRDPHHQPTPYTPGKPARLPLGPTTAPPDYRSASPARK
ncbi:Paired mesoderm homeobox protein 2B [Branchiostoma belcheri]|nr:Paired mesoderm homeobox protein 2B [Branchiostoma belcheri]